MSERSFEHDPSREEHEVPEHFDALIVLAKGWKEYFSKHKGDKPLKLSMESKMVTMAIGEMMKNDFADKVIITGGKTAGPDKPSESHEMLEYLLQNYPEEAGKFTLDDSLILEEQATDTVQNAENVTKMLEDRNISGPVALMAIGYQLERARRLFENEGISAKAFPAEDYLIKRNKHYEKFLEKYSSSAHVTIHKVKEFVMRFLLWIDPKGEIPATVTGRIRHRKNQPDATKQDTSES